MKDWYPTKTDLINALNDAGAVCRVDGWLFKNKKIVLMQDQKSGRGWTFGYV
jgi:hypothetical protein